MDLTQVPNASYYIFSTIAQTLATALGLIAAFAVFKISRINAIVDDSTSYLSSRRFSEENNLKVFTAIHDGKYEVVLSVWKSQTSTLPSGTWSDYHEMYAKRVLFEKSLTEVKVIQSRLGTSFRISGAVILYSILMIAMTPFSACSPIFSYLLFVLGFIGTIISGLVLLKLIRSTI